MNEKEKAQAIDRALKIQPNESPEVKELQKGLQENIAEESRLYAARGYGGYISTGEIEAIRKTTQDYFEQIERIRSRGEV